MLAAEDQEQIYRPTVMTIALLETPSHHPVTGSMPNLFVGLAGELIECRLPVLGERNSRNRSGVYHTGDGTNFLQFRLHESHLFGEVLISKQRVLKCQQFFAL